MNVIVRISKEKKEKDFRMVVIPSGRDKIGIIQTKDYGIIAYPDKKVLEISINEHELTKQQIDNIKRGVDYGKQIGVEVKFIIEK